MIQQMLQSDCSFTSIISCLPQEKHSFDTQKTDSWSLLPVLMVVVRDVYLKVKVLVFQSCPGLCDPMNCSPTGSSVHGILQARILLPFPSPADLHDPGIEPRSPVLQADSLPSEPSQKKSPTNNFINCIHITYMSQGCILFNIQTLTCRDEKEV